MFTAALFTITQHGKTQGVLQQASAYTGVVQRIKRDLATGRNELTSHEKAGISLKRTLLSTKS